jgi:hypothetical protein
VAAARAGATVLELFQPPVVALRRDFVFLVVFEVPAPSRKGKKGNF